MSNGENSWGVPFSHIMWLQRLLETHGNIASISRSQDILFTVVRKTQKDELKILCLREYTMGLTMVQRALAEFGPIDLIYIGAGWNGYTPEAKSFALENQVGLYVSGEMSGALWRTECWGYHKKDDKNNPVYFYCAS